MIRNTNVRHPLLFLVTEDRQARHPMAVFPFIGRASGRKGSKHNCEGRRGHDNVADRADSGGF
jgi:hypothetical protein